MIKCKMKKNILAIIIITTILSTSLVNGLHSSQSGEIGEYISQFLTDTGNYTGNINAVGDYSTTGKKFYIQPPKNTTYRLSRMLITLTDIGITNSDEYGAMPARTNGVTFWIERNGTLTEIDGNNNHSTRTNGDYVTLMYDFNCDFASLANGKDYCTGRWTFDNSGTVLRLNGNTNDKFIAQFNDSFTGLIDHHFLVQGYEEKQEIKQKTNKGNNMIGIALSGFLILIFMFYLSTGEMKKEHTFFRLLLIIFFFIILILLGKASLDNCYLTSINGAITEVCIEHGTQTYNIFFKVTSWLFGIFWVYILVYASYKAFLGKWIMKTFNIKKKKQ